jgi:hypothetical protein
MSREGPALEKLLRRLTETPADFQAEPRIGKKGTVAVAAVVGDVCRRLAIPPGVRELASFAPGGDGRERNRLSVALLLAWIVADPWFVVTSPQRDALFELLDAGARELAEVTPAGKFVADPERREELVRYALARLGLRPLGETEAQAQDRLTTLSSAERARVLKAARAAEERARAIREALARKAAQESADKWTRE